MRQIVEDLPQTCFIERNCGRQKESLEGLPCFVVAVFCGRSPPSLDEISGVFWKGEEVFRLLFSPCLVVDLRSGLPPPILDSLHLVAWKISGGVKTSTPSLQTPEISSRLGGDLPQRSDTTMPGSPSRTSFPLPKFHFFRPV